MKEGKNMKKIIIEAYNKTTLQERILDVIYCDVTIIIANEQSIRVIKHFNANNQKSEDYNVADDERINIRNWGN